jgi:hypothetical protein
VRSLWVRALEKLSEKKIGKSLAKILAVSCLQITQMSRPNVEIRTREREYCSEAALCANSITPNYLISHDMGYIGSVDEVAAPPTVPCH